MSTQETKNTPLMGKTNLIWVLIGIAVMCVGLLLMAGGKSEDPNVFREGDVYGFRRLTLAPILIIAGLVIEVYAIFKKNK
ncbi:DUF3098 domain-containing protein [Gynurincola endophyticus]|jgi:uncharacterized membrane protein|uniref:DUF3098 domain-containing protein n=1 Tax=Gynurincola endophyticus TaxID=2479004 RepID=UPI000F8E36D3|nr:DUF3098 domain-containing protein [Gynurincola endophyticus]